MKRHRSCKLDADTTPRTPLSGPTSGVHRSRTHVHSPLHHAAPLPRGHSAHVEARWPPHSTPAGESLTILGFGPIRMGVSVGHLPSADHVQRLPYIGSSQNALSFSLYERHPPGTSTINSSHFEGLPRIDASRKSTRSSGGRHVGAAFCPIARGLGQSPMGVQEHCLPLVGSSQNRLSFTLYVRHPPSTPACRSSHCFGLDLTYLDGSASRTSVRSSGGTQGANVGDGPASQHSQSAERPNRMPGTAPDPNTAGGRRFFMEFAERASLAPAARRQSCPHAGEGALAARHRRAVGSVWQGAGAVRKL